MHQFTVGWEATLNGAEGEEAEVVLDEAMDQLLACSDLIDPNIFYNSGTRAVDLEVTVQAEDTLDAITKASTLIRAALHASGAGTPGWPHSDELKRAHNAHLDDWRQMGQVKQLQDA